MSYQIQKLDDGIFTITHPGRTFGGDWTFKTEEEARRTIRFLQDEECFAARAEAAWDDYCERHDYD